MTRDQSMASSASIRLSVSREAQSVDDLSSPDGFKQTEIGLIPEEWIVARIKEHCEKPEYGYTESASTENVGPKFLRITDIQDRGVDWSTVPYCRVPTEKFKKYELRDGDILFARIGATTGKSYIIADCPPAVFASYLIRLRTKPSIDPKFLYFFFNSEAYWKQVNANKGANLKQGVSGAVLAELLFAYPQAKDEQRAIAHILSKIQAAAETQAAIAGRARELKRALMAKLFTEGLRGEPLKETEIGVMPEGWEVVKLGDVVKKKITDGTHKTPMYVEEGIPFVTATNISNDRIDFENCKRITLEEHQSLAKRCKPERGDVLLSKVGTLGLVAEVQTDVEFSIFVQVALIKPQRAKVDPSYLTLILGSDPLQSQILQTASQSTMKYIGVGKIATLQIPLPPIEEQREIARILQTVNAKIASTERKRARLEELFRAMLGQLMTGRVRVIVEGLTKVAV